jgi:hypothetical protein
MSTITPMQWTESPTLAEWIPTPLFRMTLERYEEMVESGALTEHDRVHLINGFLVKKWRRAILIAWQMICAGTPSRRFCLVVGSFDRTSR